MQFEQLPYIFIDISQPGEKGNFLVKTSDGNSGELITENQLKEKISYFEYFYTARRIEDLDRSRTDSVTNAGKDRQADLIRYGQRLYVDLFGSDNRFKRYLTRRDHLGKGAKLVLRLHTTASQLWNIPWEYVHDGEQFIGLHSHYTILRFLNDIRLAREIATPAPPTQLHLLFVISSPRNAPPLHVNAEISIIRNAIQKAGGNISIDFVEQGTLENLQRALAVKDYHALHYSGHGAFNAGGSFLVMEDVNGMATPVYLEQILPLIDASPQLQFVFLNACKTGNINESTASSGLAAGLMQAVPAVLAMQFSIRDDRASRFAEAFYGGIGRGESLEQATHSARMALSSSDAVAGDWGVPSLYLQLPNMRLVGRNRPELSRITATMSSIAEPRPQASQGLEQLPLTDPFSGRREEQRALRGFLADRKPLVYVWGIAGIGKSALVRQVLERPGTELSIDAVLVIPGDTTPQEVIISIGRFIAANFPAAAPYLRHLLTAPGESIAALSKIVQGKRVVIVLDGFERQMSPQDDRHWEFTSPELRALCMALTKADWSIITIVTSRFRWSHLMDVVSQQRCEITVGGLLAEDMAFMYQELMDATSSKAEKIGALLTLTGGHPRTLSDIVQRVKAKPVLLDSPNWSDILVPYWKRGFLDQLLGYLKPPERDALDVMSIHQSAFKPEHAQNLVSLSALDESETLVTVWETLSLAQYVGTDEQETPWYVIPNYIKTAISASISEENKKALHKRVALSIQKSLYKMLQGDANVPLAKDADLLPKVLGGLEELFKQAQMPLVDRYVNLVYAWQEHYRKADDITRANQIALALMLPLSIVGRSKEMQELATAILEATPGDSPAALWANYWEGVCKMRDKEFDVALNMFSRVTKATARRNDVGVLYARALERQGNVLRAQGKNKEALARWKECASVCASANDRTGMARVMTYLAETQFFAGQQTECLNYVTQGIKAYEAGRLSNEDMLILGLLMLHRAHLHRVMGNDFEAIKGYAEVIRIGKEVGSGYLIAQACEYTGHVYMLLRQYELAARQLAAAIDIYEHAGSHADLSMALTRLAVLQDFRGNANDALGHAERANRLAEEYLPANIDQTRKLVQTIKRKAR